VCQYPHFHPRWAVFIDMLNAQIHHEVHETFQRVHLNAMVCIGSTFSPPVSRVIETHFLSDLSWGLFPCAWNHPTPPAFYVRIVSIRCVDLWFPLTNLAIPSLVAIARWKREKKWNRLMRLWWTLEVGGGWTKTIEKTPWTIPLWWDCVQGKAGHLVTPILRWPPAISPEIMFISMIIESKGKECGILVKMGLLKKC